MVRIERNTTGESRATKKLTRKSKSAMLAMVAAGSSLGMVRASLPDRARVVNARNSGSMGKRREKKPIEGPRYRVNNRNYSQREAKEDQDDPSKRLGEGGSIDEIDSALSARDEEHVTNRELSSQLSGCCSNYKGYYAEDLCDLYGMNCQYGGGKSHDSGDGSCTTDGLSFIGVSFSVNTAKGNPYSYQLNDQFPMENIIDRDYDYIMSMDEDGWLIGGGYKTFDYSGKMPYIDSSHTELLRIGNMDPTYGGTTIGQVYNAMATVSLPPLSIYPEYVKGGGGHGDDDDGSGSVPSGDVTLVISVVDVYNDDSGYSEYELFLVDLFNAMEYVGGGSCMDDHDTDPHISMSRGVKFKSSYHAYQYYYNSNLEVAVWQYMYPNGVVIGSNGKAAFPPNSRRNPSYVGYGNLYFFFDRANITKAFPATARDLSDNEYYYSTLWSSSSSSDISTYYSAVTTIGFDWQAGSGSNDGGDGDDYEHNPYNWKAQMAIHDMTDGWDLPPNCGQEGETFFGIPLSRKSESMLQSTATFQTQFDFTQICDYNYTYVQDFGTNHGWLVGEHVDNAVGSIVDRDTAHIPIFYTGTTNPNMGGLSLSKLIKVAKQINFGTLYIKPAFCFVDDYGHLKMQFEADAYSAVGYLYDALCKALGISWGNDNPSNKYGYYTSCAMHSAGDRATYGCGPDNANSGGFCPQMYIAYGVKFQSDDHSTAYLSQCNNYVDYWRSLYPTGVATGTDTFCPDGGCLALFLNRYDVYEVFKPDLGGSWVEYNGASSAPTISPAPTFDGGCDDPRNAHLDKCFRARNKRSTSPWNTLGPIGQMCIVLITFMATTLAVSIFLARARRRKRRGEGYLGFFLRDIKRSRKKRKKRSKTKNKELTEEMLGDNYGDDRSNRRKSRSRSSSRRRSKSSSRRGASRSSSRRASRSGAQDGDDGQDRRSRSESRSRRRSRSGSRRPSEDRGDASRSPSRGEGRTRSSSKRRQLV